MKIYTKEGDGGETSLYGGQRVWKDALRVETYGTVDECNAVLGSALTLIEDAEARASPDAHSGGVVRGRGGPGDAAGNGARRRGGVRAEATARLEAEIDRFEADLPPLRHFILPGGTRGGAALHQARAVCRRAERCLVTLGQAEPSTRKWRGT